MNCFALRTRFSQPSALRHRRASRPYRLAAAAPDDENQAAKPTDNGAQRTKELKVVPTVAKTPVAATKKPARATPAKSSPSTKTFSNRNKFVVPPDLKARFDDVWKARKTFMESSKGFQGLTISDGSFRKDDWEAYACSHDARGSHLPPYVPKKGEGFPEDFAPFIDYAEAVNAKY